MRFDSLLVEPLGIRQKKEGSDGVESSEDDVLNRLEDGRSVVVSGGRARSELKNVAVKIINLSEYEKEGEEEVAYFNAGLIFEVVKGFHRCRCSRRPSIWC